MSEITFFAPMCLLDNTSGAAISVRSFLEALAAAGVRCDSFTASLFDAIRKLDLRPLFGPGAADPKSLGKRVLIKRAGVEHSVFLSSHTQSARFSEAEQLRFERSWVNWLKANKPRVVLTYGGSAFTRRLQDHARRAGARLVFYLANAEYEDADFHKPGDLLITPSNFLRDHYRNTLGLEVRVLRTIMNRDRLDLATNRDPVELDWRRRKGFVTFMTPIPHKGLTLFNAIARQMYQVMPELKFLVTEGRSSREWLARNGYDLTQRPNIWYVANHEDVRSIYQRTSVLLVPSFWQEGFSRSIQEAQLSGVPVMANDRGGCAEALNGGGFLLDPPAECVVDYMAAPSGEVVDRWCGALAGLLADPEAYRKASEVAVQAATAFHPDTATREAVRFFREVLGGDDR